MAAYAERHDHLGARVLLHRVDHGPAPTIVQHGRQLSEVTSVDSRCGWGTPVVVAAGGTRAVVGGVGLAEVGVGSDDRDGLPTSIDFDISSSIFK